MSQHDVLTKDDVASAAAEEPAVHRFSQGQAERTRNRLRDEHDELVLQEGAQTRPADNQRAVFGARAARLTKELILRTRDLARPPGAG